MAPETEPRMPPEQDDRIELVEESVSVEKERSVIGRVRVSTATSVVEDVIPVTLTGATVEVTRERLDRVVDTIPQTRVEGDTTIIPVVEEIVVVEKRLVLVEEIRA